MATAAVPYSFAPSTTILSAEANANFSALVSFLNASVIHADGSVAFTAVPTGPATDPTTANQLVRKSYVDVPYAVLKKSTNFASSSSTQGPFSSFTTLGSRGMTVSTSRITCVTAGVYEIGASFGVGTNTTGVRGLLIRQNGSNLIGDADEADGTTGFGKRVILSSFVSMVATDYLDLMWKQDSGSTLAGDIALWAIKVPGT